MRIENISAFKINKINKKQNQSNATTNKIKNDSFSFKGKILSQDELRNLKLKSWQIQDESIKHKKDAISVKDEAYEAFQEGRDEFMQALRYCDAFKKNPSKIQVELKNGNTLFYQFQFKNGNLTLEIEELTFDGQMVKTISALNFTPFKVINYDDDKVDVYEYRGNRVGITKNLSISSDDFGTCKSSFSFVNGKLDNANINGKVSPIDASEFNETYIYFNDAPVVCSIDSQIDSEGKCYSSERFVYIDGSFSNYYSNFKGDVHNGMSWDESLHYNKGRLIGSINNGVQKGKNQDILSSDAVYLDDNNQFIHTTKLRARVSDFGLPIFADCE